MKDLTEIYQDIGIMKEQYTDITERVLSKKQLKKFNFDLSSVFYSSNETEEIKAEITFSGKIDTVNFKTVTFYYNSEIDNYETFKNNIRSWLFDTLDFLVNVF